MSARAPARERLLDAAEDPDASVTSVARIYDAHPIRVKRLDGDRLMGKVDARTDRDLGALRVARIHWDVDPEPRQRRAVDGELEALAAFLGVRLAVDEPR